MMRRLAVLMLIGSSAGCAMLDGYDDHEWRVYEAPPVAVTQQPTCGTNVVPASYNQTQTQEPPR